MKKPKRPPQSADAATWEKYYDDLHYWNLYYADSSGNDSGGRRRRGGKGVRATGQALGLAAGIAFTGAQAYAEPTQNSQNTQGNYADSEARNRRDSQTRGHRQDTTYKGRQRGGSSQSG